MVSSSISSKQAGLGRGSKAPRHPRDCRHRPRLRKPWRVAKRLHASSTDHLFARVGQPQDKAFVEGVIGSYETECLSLGGLADTRRGTTENNQCLVS